MVVQADARIDPESLERDNDRDIDSLADKTSFLRKVCTTYQRSASVQTVLMRATAFLLCYAPHS